MTYIPVQGGLGNQLFIFAMAHYLEEEFDLKIVLTFKRDRFNQGHRDNFLPEFIQNCTHNIVIKNGNVTNLLLKIVDKIDSISHKAASSIKQTFKILDFEAPDDFEHQQFYNARIVEDFFSRAI